MKRKNLYKSKIIPKDIQKTLMSKGDVSYNSHFAKFVSSYVESFMNSL